MKIVRNLNQYLKEYDFHRLRLNFIKMHCPEENKKKFRRHTLISIINSYHFYSYSMNKELNNLKKAIKETPTAKFIINLLDKILLFLTNYRH